MANLNDFIAQVKQNGMARTNRFAVEFALPNSLQGFDLNSLRTALLFCDQVQLPGLNINTTDTRSFGEVRKAPYEKLFEDINMSFYVDKDMVIKDLFDTWHDSIMDRNTRTFEYYDNYVTPITIYVQDINDNNTYTVMLYEAFPKSIGAVQLDYAAKDVMKLSVNFAYKNWISFPSVNGTSVATPDGHQTTFAVNPYNGITSNGYVQHQTDFPVSPYADVTSNGYSPVNTFATNLQNFAIGAAGSALVTRLPNLLKF